MSPSLSTRQGSALIIALFFILLISLVTVGFMGAARMERTVAVSHLERMRAENLAQQGIESVVATLRRETTYRYPSVDPLTQQTSYYYRNYITQPGALIVANVPSTSKSDQDQKELRQVIPLSTGKSSLLTGGSFPNPVLNPPNLNIRTFLEQSNPTHLITDTADDGTLPTAAATADNASPMMLKWVYVRQVKNPSAGAASVELDLTEQPILTDKDKPIVGRYAYWTDDESSKLNTNLAWKRSAAGATGITANTSSPSSPTRLNLLALLNVTEPMADRIHRLTLPHGNTPGHFYNSFLEARQLGSDISTALDQNKFLLTHYNHDPDTTFFGEDRILLTTNHKLVPLNADGTYARKFLDILRDDKLDADPGDQNNIAGGQNDWVAPGNPILPNKLDAVVKNLVRYISTQNWPLAPGLSFKDKYYPGSADSDARLAQIAVNIIDYVRAKESAKQFIAPMRFGLSGGFSMNAGVAYGVANSYQGICRNPYITELGCWVDATPVTAPVGSPPGTAPPPGWPKTDSGFTPLYPTYFTMEIFLPSNYGFVDAKGAPLGIDFANGWFATWTETRDPGNSKYYYPTSSGAMTPMSSHETNAVRIAAADIKNSTANAKSVLMPGSYIVVTKIFYRDNSYNQVPFITTRGAIYYGNAGADGLLASLLNQWPRINICPQADAFKMNLADPAKTSRADMPSMETDDPRANVARNDWFPTVGGKNTLGRINSVSTLGKAPAAAVPTVPQQDVDASGKLTDYSMYMPPPKGFKGNESGQVLSIGELGYISTGNDAKTGKNSVSWRTMRLQPNNLATAQQALPDWAFMDLFAVPSPSNFKDPNAPPPIVGSPEDTRLKTVYVPHGTSVGGRVNVNSHVEPFDQMQRKTALTAVLKGTTSLVGNADDVAANIYNRTLAPTKNGSFGKVYGYPWKPSPAPTDSNAYDTAGEICEIKGVADGGEKSENLLREIMGLITSRGGVFSIYSIGQSLIQTPAGKLLVTGEQRKESIVERYLDNRGTASTSDDLVSFRTVYSRNLSP